MCSMSFSHEKLSFILKLKKVSGLINHNHENGYKRIRRCNPSFSIKALPNWNKSVVPTAKSQSRIIQNVFVLMHVRNTWSMGLLGQKERQNTDNSNDLYHWIQILNHVHNSPNTNWRRTNGMFVTEVLQPLRVQSVYFGSKWKLFFFKPRYRIRTLLSKMTALWH